MHEIFKTDVALREPGASSIRSAKLIVTPVDSAGLPWLAYAEGWEEKPQGWGKTPSDALRDLADVLEDEG